MVTIGVQKAKLGSTVYYIGKMRAGELIGNVGFVAVLPEWSEMTADEKMQRQPDNLKEFRNMWITHLCISACG